MRFAELDAVTVDGLGTLLALVDPVPALQEALRERGFERNREQVLTAFRAEADYYRPRSLRGRDQASLAELRRECVEVFLGAAGAELDPASFVEPFIDAIRFEAFPGAVETLEALRARGLELAVVSNWDCALRQHLGRLGVDRLFSAVISSAEAGAAKPDPAPFLAALARLGVEPHRSLHVGDEPADERGSRAAGMRFAPAPLATAFEGWS